MSLEVTDITDTAGRDLEEIIAAKREQFPHALGVALVPDRLSHERVLALTDVVFRSVHPKEGLRLNQEKIPHVSLFQNMFRDPEQLSRIVETALTTYSLRNEFRIQTPPNDVCIWAENRAFINHEVTPDLALFHDLLLVECLVKGSDTICAGCPADHRPIQGLSPEQERAYRETGYVFSGADTELARQHGVPWKAFTIPHFTLGVIDWDTRPADESIDQTRNRITNELRAELQVQGLTKCRFEKLTIFRVRPGGVYVPTPDNTVKEYELAL